MPILESDIAILIPTYRYRDKVVRAVETALASGAGEIIVVDDRGQDGTIERLAAYGDSRLKVFENARNLGLWENHLHTLSLATRPWIKFIQADDYLLPSGLSQFAAAANDGVCVVAAVPVVKDDETGATWQFHNLIRPRRLSPAEIQTACLFGGWILGSPSQVMMRADVIERDPKAWQKQISADLVIGFIATARGDTVMLPPGSIASAAHPLQDSQTQGTQLGLERSIRSLAYLRDRPEPGLRRLANLWCILQLRFLFRMVATGLLKREAPISILATAPRLLTDLSRQDWRDIVAAQSLLRAAARFRRSAQRPLDLDSLLDYIETINSLANQTPP